MSTPIAHAQHCTRELVGWYRDVRMPVHQVMVHLLCEAIEGALEWAEPLEAAGRG